MKLQENVPLAPYTTFGVGGPAKYLAEALSESDVRNAVDFARSKNLTLFVLGGGSNLVVSDDGYPGVVLKIGIRGTDISGDRERRLFQVGAGEDWDTFVAQTVEDNCSGLECLSGIPGTVGATPVQNVGAYGQEVADTVEQVYALDLTTGLVRELTPEQCGFSYRTSIFNTTEKGRFIILGVRFALIPGGEPKIAYRDLQSYFAGGSGKPSLAEVRKAVREIRHRKGMLIVEGDDDCRSAGSFFKNPIVSNEKFADVQGIAEKRGITVPSFPGGDGMVKIPAAWLVEQSGFAKGYTRGPAGISRKHSLAIVNRGGAKASDIIALKNEIQSAVAGQFGIELKPEPVFL
ncbi:MAG TPA: UDP-N-acetylmuramate dehydrogenase [Terriglobales bacterium]|nr:UDP-N-acetylmuramate dehydrogenase [Terriglobales bacterium]